MTSTQMAATGVRSIGGVMDMFCADLTPAEMLHRPVAKGNCAAWTLGHLVLAMRFMATAFGVKDFPALPAGFETRFGQKDGAPDAADFGDTSILLPLFRSHTAILASAIEAFPVDKLATPLERPLPVFKTIGEMAAFASIHHGIHAGQISTIRRSLGRPPII